MLNSSEHDISEVRLICGMKFSLSQEKRNGGNLIYNKKCLFISFYNFSCVSRPAIKELHFNALFTIFSSADTFAIAMVQMTMNFVTIIKTINIR